VINDVLDFSKIEAGMLHFEKINFDLGFLIEEVLEIMAERAQSKGLELVAFPQEDIPLLLNGDPNRLKQVLLNLLSNAIKFTEKGEVTLRVSKKLETSDKVEVLFEVKDSGIGISPDNQSKLFQAFSQGDSSTTRKFGGTGLGLVISKKIIEMMNGKIWMESDPGKGSQFFFTATFQKQPDGAKRSFPAENTLVGLRVLVVDDNETNRKIVHHQVLSWKMRNGTAATGKDALEILRNASRKGDPYTLAILDFEMPEMDGISLAREIKADPLTSSCHIVIMSSVGHRREFVEARKVGVEAYLTKPVKPSSLFDTLSRVVMESNLTAETESSTKSSTEKNEAKILLVEDNPTNQRVITRQLEKMGFSPDLAITGTEAVSKIFSQPYDLVFMDCQLPELDGYAATRQIRLKETKRHTPIVAMTAHAMQGDREKCLAAGMDDYISKPIDHAKLREVLNKYLARKTPQPPQDSNSFRRDFEEAARRLDGHQDVLLELIDCFIEFGPQQFQELQEAITAKNRENATRMAHTLKGSISHLTQRHAFELAQWLEKNSPQASFEEISHKNQELEKEVSALIQACKEYSHLKHENSLS
jgi:two-component system, sensor histidine kinase and response regulator